MATSSWSKVMVRNGAQNSKEWLLKTLSSKIHAQLIPVQCHVLGDKTIFFIEDHDMAMKLKQLGNLPSAGGELRIVVKPSPPPLQGRVLKQNGVQGVMYRPEFANVIMSQIVNKCPDINHVEEISKVANPSIVNLSLEGNSFINACGDFRKYSSLMREKFPNLQTLDGHVLHSPVKFDLPVASSAALPETKPSYLMNDEVKDFLKLFIEQYYNMYDDEKSREGLLSAYSSEAVFSLSVVTSERLKGPYLGEYTKRGRNIMKVYREKRESLLQHGKLDVVKALNDLPKTKHVPSSFIVDVSQATPSLVVFSLWGLFAEVSHQTPVRAFSRMFVITSSQGSVSIINDQLTVRNATPNQVQMVRETLGSQLQTTSPVVTTPAPVTSPLDGAATTLQGPTVTPVPVTPPLAGAATMLQGPVVATPVPVTPPLAGAASTLQGLASFTSGTTSLLIRTMIQPQPLITILPSLSPHLLAEPSLEQKQLLITQLAGGTGMNQQFSENYRCSSENRWQYDKAMHTFQCLKDKKAVPQAFIQ